jgi:hypothetical protein
MTIQTRTAGEGYSLGLVVVLMGGSYVAQFLHELCNGYAIVLMTDNMKSMGVAV